MSHALLLDWYYELPQANAGDDPHFWGHRIQKALRTFRKRVNKRYTEGTLQRLLTSESTEYRKAAVVALSLVGTTESNTAMARMLQDADESVAGAANDGIWEVWFRGGTDVQNRQLQTIIHTGEPSLIIVKLTELLLQAPRFAELYNQRAIAYFQRGDLQRSIVDCERTLELNPHHFGAQAGMAECFRKLNKPRAALRAYKLALKINPTLTHLHDAIRELDSAPDES